MKKRLMGLWAVGIADVMLEEWGTRTRPDHMIRVDDSAATRILFSELVPAFVLLSFLAVVDDVPYMNTLF